MVFGFEKIKDIAMYIDKLNLMETVMNKIKWSTRFFGHSVQKDKSQEFAENHKTSPQQKITKPLQKKNIFQGKNWKPS